MDCKSKLIFSGNILEDNCLFTGKFKINRKRYMKFIKIRLLGIWINMKKLLKIGIINMSHLSGVISMPVKTYSRRTVKSWKKRSKTRNSMNLSKKKQSEILSLRKPGTNQQRWPTVAARGSTILRKDSQNQSSWLKRTDQTSSHKLSTATKRVQVLSGRAEKTS